MKPGTRKDGGLAAGRACFRLEAVKSARLPFVAEVECVACGDTVRVPFGIAAAVFRIGNEFVGVVCDACLDEGTQDLLARARETAVRGHVMR